MRVNRLLTKGGKLRGLAKFIHDAQPEGELSQSAILSNLSGIASLVPPRKLTLAKIETCAKTFYGIEARLAKKKAKEKKLAAMRKKTAHNVRARLDKSRNNRRIAEINRVAEVWNLPEIMQAKDVKHAHSLDRFLSKVSEKGFKPVRILMTPDQSKDEIDRQANVLPR